MFFINTSRSLMKRNVFIEIWIFLIFNVHNTQCPIHWTNFSKTFFKKKLLGSVIYHLRIVHMKFHLKHTSLSTSCIKGLSSIMRRLKHDNNIFQSHLKLRLSLASCWVTFMIHNSRYVISPDQTDASVDKVPIRTIYYVSLANLICHD